MDVFTPGIHASTYGSNPLACAVVVAAHGVLIELGSFGKCWRPDWPHSSRTRNRYVEKVGMISLA
jgi:hypothetical protein